MAPPKKRLGEMLVEAGIIDESKLNAALAHQRQWGGRLGAALIEMKLVSEEAIVDALALKFGFEIARLDRIEPYAFEQAKAFVPRDYAMRNRIFPLSADTGVLVVAMSDPTNLALTDELAFKSGRRVKVCIAGDHAIGLAIRHHFGEDMSGVREAIALEPDDTAMEPLYDPIGATSSEQLDQFFQQSGPAAPVHPAPAPPAVARGSAPRAASRLPAVLQLEDQQTGSLPLEPEPADDVLEEELQPIPLDAEPEPVGEAAAAIGEVAAETGHAEAQLPPRELTSEEAEVLAAVWRMADGDEAQSVVRPSQLLAVLIRLMVRKQWLTEQELLDEILRGGEPV